MAIRHVLVKGCLVKCDCGFIFETKPGTFRNFNIAIGDGYEIWYCPKCETEYKVDKK
jgi:hypothetical protein